MLQLTDGVIAENGAAVNSMTITDHQSLIQSLTNANCGTLTVGSTFYSPYYQPIYWQSYPVYVCSDKTKKAIEVLKALQAEKLLKCDSVPRFIALVEKISNLL